ncbi:MAG: ABC transporter ATP-binding protein [Acidimicrobiia bacterium]
MTVPTLDVRDLRVAVMDADELVHRDQDRLFIEPYGPFLPRGFVPAVRGVSFRVDPGEVLAIVGESGSGKSLSVLGALGLLTPGAAVLGGTVDCEGVRLRPTAHLVRNRNRWWRRWRKRRRKAPFMEELLDDAYRTTLGTRIGVLFQSPVASWTPAELIGEQAAEAVAEHSDLSKEEITDRVLDALGETQLPAKRGYLSFRHEMSRGQAQRAMLAAALVKAPSLLIADEPLTGLDAPVAAAICELMRDMQRKRNMAMILVTHDLATVASMADRVAVMYGGRIIEEGPIDEIFRRPRHPYTDGLLGSLPSRGVDRLRPIAGSPPKITRIPDDSCAFAPRCPHVTAACTSALPGLERIGTAVAACVHKAQLDLPGIGS